MRKFSERKQLKQVSDLIQIESMTAELRNSLWNVLDKDLWSTTNYLYRQYGKAEIDDFSESLWFNFYKKPIDSSPDTSSRKIAYIRKHFFDYEWYEVYDFLEFVTNYYKNYTPLHEHINKILERELAGYRLISGCIVDIIDEQEVRMLEEAFKETKFEGVTGHLRRALELLADRESPDYRNSIKESISAVEGMAKIITGDQKATLGTALNSLERAGNLHPALKDGFSKLYGYTSDEGGIRHSMMTEPEIDSHDAKYFLLSCTSFVNYLKSRLS